MARSFGFGQSLHSAGENWLEKFKNSKSETKVIVIRNPWDRLQSAINLSSALTSFGQVGKIGKTPARHVRFDRTFARSHSVPYVTELYDSGFEDYFIIDFYKFSDYIPTRHYPTISTNANYSGLNERIFDSSGNYLQSTKYSHFWSMEELHKEDRAYNKIMKKQPKLPVSLFQTFYK